jgi:uncharacterized protein (DUF433 family)
MDQRKDERRREVAAAAKGLVREMVDGEPYEYYPLGEYIVAAPGVCGGEPTFKYTRINVRFVLERVRGGESREDIVADYRGRFPLAALEEAMRLDAAGLLDEPAVPALRTA